MMKHWRVCLLGAVLQATAFLTVSLWYMHTRHPGRPSFQGEIRNVQFPTHHHGGKVTQGRNIASNESRNIAADTARAVKAIHKERQRVSTVMRKTHALQIYKPNTPLRYYTFDTNTTRNMERGWIERMTSHRSCAIIGNSGVLNGSQCGASIDAHSYVIRINLAPIGGKFHLDVGSKANMVTANRYQFDRLWELMKNLKLFHVDKYRLIWERLQMYSRSIVWILKGLESPVKERFKYFQHWLRRRRKTHIRWAYPTKSIVHATERIWKIKSPTSGLIILATAVLFCDEVTLYGFYPFSVDANGTDISNHYYELDSVSSPKLIHKPSKEYHLLQDFAKRGVLRLVTKSCV